jgi:hypothetical protein
MEQQQQIHNMWRMEQQQWMMSHQQNEPQLSSWMEWMDLMQENELQHQIEPRQQIQQP